MAMPYTAFPAASHHTSAIRSHYVGRIVYDLLMGRPPQGASARETPITARFSEAEAKMIDDQRAARGFGDRSSYLRHLVWMDRQKLIKEKDK